MDFTKSDYFSELEVVPQTDNTKHLCTFWILWHHIKIQNIRKTISAILNYTLDTIYWLKLDIYCAKHLYSTVMQYTYSMYCITCDSLQCSLKSI